ncbi:hypothetical protein JCM10450v2_006157 [Rhodotorula kratochvilovae]
MATPVELPPLPPFNSLKPLPRSTPAIAALQATLGSLYRLTVSGPTPRQYLGTFVCLDPQGNLVLDGALEFELDADGQVRGDPAGREVGLVMVPRRWWTSVERLKSEDERREELERAQGQT